MIYKASPIQVHRVEISTVQDQFIPTSSFETRLLDLSILSHFNEDQSMMSQFPGVNPSSSSRTMNTPYAYLTPFPPQTTTSEHSQAPIAAATSSSFGYSPSYTHSDVSTGQFEDATTAYEVSTTNPSYTSYTGSSPLPLTYFHPPMLAPPQHDATPPAASPVSPILPGPSPRQPELQIRMSQPCYEMGQRHHEILPLETGPFKK